MNSQPIGLFDSGVGGLNIWKEITNLMQSESTIYIADNHNAPYGQKDKNTVMELSIKNTELLIAKGCKLVVVACNTATTSAISHLRKHISIPFIGIEPAIKPASLNTKSGIIGVLATRGTLVSDLFGKTSSLYGSNIRIINQVGHRLVELIEDPLTRNVELEDLLRKYLSPMVEQGIDNLVLGCTHYSFLKSLIKKIIPDYIKIIDSGKAVALQVERVLGQHQLLNISKTGTQHQFYTTGDTKNLENFLHRIRPTKQYNVTII